MSWMARLYETYEQAMERQDVVVNRPMPISHTVQNAHIQIVIDGQGNFRSAKVLEKTQITLPATEKSAGRSSGEAPHSLADKIQYAAGDYADFGGKKNAYFDSYQQQLGKWCDSNFSCDSIKAVYNYISKKTLVRDLLEAEILFADNGVLRTSWDSESEPPALFKLLPKEKGFLDQGNALVCWVVEDADIQYPKTWEDPFIQQQWIAFDAQINTETAFCYVSGKIQPVALNHPAKLRHSGDKAKLISANDSSGYTFRGRFTDTSGLQSASISSITTQKAHNALRWLINRKETYKNGDQVIVAWAISGKPIPPPIGAVLDYDDDEFVENLGADFASEYAERLNKYFRGYRQELEADPTVSVMAIDSATPGRMGIIYYRESMPDDYLDVIQAWHEDFAWWQRISKDKSGSDKTTWRMQAPLPRHILQAIYGDIIKSNENLKKQFHQRLLPCLLERANIPEDIWQLAFHQACKSSNKEYWEWERNLGIACALYKGYRARHYDKSQQREFSMALDTTTTSRDYLYGRLLALAERLESVALRIADINRPTTANRLMQRFADNPYTTWLTIYKQLDPYIRQLSSSRPEFLGKIQKQLDEVMSKFDRDEFMLMDKLKPEFLLGFHCQRLALGKAKNDDKTEPSTEEEQQ